MTAARRRILGPTPCSVKIVFDNHLITDTPQHSSCVNATSRQIKTPVEEERFRNVMYKIDVMTRISFLHGSSSEVLSGGQGIKTFQNFKEPKFEYGAILGINPNITFNSSLVALVGEMVEVQFASDTDDRSNHHRLGDDQRRFPGAAEENPSTSLSNGAKNMSRMHTRVASIPSIYTFRATPGRVKLMLTSKLGPGGPGHAPGQPSYARSRANIVGQKGSVSMRRSTVRQTQYDRRVMRLIKVGPGRSGSRPTKMYITKHLTQYPLLCVLGYSIRKPGPTEKPPPCENVLLGNPDTEGFEAIIAD
ncbi:hypothetical protein GGX14DRAFT_406574 [Mycena pura]|uniref:Uncharacterized protein n=1 Tax=Mycena pura TaxID=153505 RepID=A0AAD6XY33_9AGAR|nr:hypothetical protein GGX14DRAFT_406574 [Mycena pura]